MKNSRQQQALRLEIAFGGEMSEENRRRTASLAHYRESREAKKALLRQLHATSGATARIAALLALTDRL